MFGLDNPIHIVFILVLLLLVFGAKRLPEMGRSLGTGLRGFKESISGEHDPTADLKATPSAPRTAVTPAAQPAVSSESAPAHVDQSVNPAAAEPPVTAEPLATAEPAVTAEPVMTGEPVLAAAPVAKRVPVWRA